MTVHKRILTAAVLLAGIAAVSTHADTKGVSLARQGITIAQGIGDQENFDDLALIRLPFLNAEDPDRGYGGFPLDTGIVPDPWSFRTRKDEFGFWAYASKNGRVRTRVRTGSTSGTSSAVRNQLLWQGRFVRDSANLPTFTLNLSWLEVAARQYSKGPQRLFDPRLWGKEDLLTKEELEEKRPGIFDEPQPPFAEMEFYVYVFGLESGRHNHDHEVFWHWSRVAGIAYDDPDEGHPLELKFNDTAGWYDRNFDWIDSPEDHPVKETEQGDYNWEPYCIDLFQLSGSSNECQQKIHDRYHYRIGPYTGRMDLDAMGISPGDRYLVVYELDVKAGEDQAEQFAEAFLADPLDNDAGGLTLETTDSPVAGPSQICDTEPDGERYRLNPDGSATDRRTGLMWQRCPLGTMLDELGTIDPDDDLCILGTDLTLDWQAALAAADANVAAGYSDWRMPNVKELESLTLPGCINAAADRLAFPDTPATGFWSSTPLREDPIAWQVDFFQGDVRWATTDQAAWVRLVRDSGAAPELLRPEIRIADAHVEESGDGETAVLDFPVSLSRPIAEDVTVAWTVIGNTAVEDEDFVGGNGLLSIPAGAEFASIQVTVTGDSNPEPDESLYVELAGASENARLAVADGWGVIVDDEPRLRGSIAQAVEGDAGSSELVVRFYLDRPALETLSVDYATADVSATAGTDYAAQRGVLQFAAGDVAAEIRIPVYGDRAYENDERLDIEFSDFDGLHISQDVFEATIVDDDGPGTYAALNDTGITHCATDSSGYLSCPQAGLGLQDGDIGRDLTDPDPDDGNVGFSFTKLDPDGTDLASTATTWSCVQDNVTGLVWENKSFDETSPNYRYWTYSWRNDSGVHDGGDPGVIGGGECLVTDTCDTQQFVDQMNTTALCGYSDWRLPSVGELFSISDNGLHSQINSAGLDSNYFRPNPSNGDGAYWSGTPAAGNATSAWMVQINRFGTRARDYGKRTPAFVRLVRGGVQ